ncbi:cysteine-rich protein [Rhizoctonia solani]|nr:cysteine-rich protein [Rhizoctonia solani]
MKLTITSAFALVVLALNTRHVHAGPATMGACYTACNVGYVTCCATAGVTAGVFTLGLGVPAALGACSVVQGACMAACVPLGFAPTP